MAGDELHGVVVTPLGHADAEHGNDVGVVQPGGGAGLPTEALQPLGIDQRFSGQQFQGDVAAERFLDGLVDDAHAALAEATQDAELAHTRGVARLGGGRVIAGLRDRFRLELLHLDQRGEQLADGLGQVRVAIGVLGQPGTFAAAKAGNELLGETIERIAVGG